MAISVDAQGGLIQTGFAAGGIRSWSHTCSGNDRFLVVSVGLWQDVAGTGTINSITYAGDSLTKAQGVTQGAMRAEIWYLKNPKIGSALIHADISGNTDDRKFRSVSYTGVNGLDTSTSGTGATGDLTLNITTGSDNCWVQDSGVKFTTTAATIGAGQTSVMNDTTGTTLAVASYEGPKTPAGSVTMSWTNAAAADWSLVALSFSPQPDLVIKQAWIKA